MPLSGMRGHDNWMWSHTRNAYYSVCSSYHCAIDMQRRNTEPSTSTPTSGGSRLWNLDLPEKVRLTIWSAYRNTYTPYKRESMQKACDGSTGVSCMWFRQ
ncbi:hypothetical protein SLA2020_479340 [Shorea laevis]